MKHSIDKFTKNTKYLFEKNLKAPRERLVGHDIPHWCLVYTVNI